MCQFPSASDASLSEPTVFTPVEDMLLDAGMRLYERAKQYMSANYTRSRLLSTDRRLCHSRFCLAFLYSTTGIHWPKPLVMAAIRRNDRAGKSRRRPARLPGGVGGQPYSTNCSFTHLPPGLGLEPRRTEPVRITSECTFIAYPMSPFHVEAPPVPLAGCSAKDMWFYLDKLGDEQFALNVHSPWSVGQLYGCLLENDASESGANSSGMYSFGGQLHPRLCRILGTSVWQTILPAALVSRLKKSKDTEKVHIIIPLCDHSTFINRAFNIWSPSYHAFTHLSIALTWKEILHLSDLSPKYLDRHQAMHLESGRELVGDAAIVYDLSSSKLVRHNIPLDGTVSALLGTVRCALTVPAIDSNAWILERRVTRSGGSTQTGRDGNGIGSHESAQASSRPTQEQWTCDVQHAAGGPTLLNGYTATTIAASSPLPSDSPIPLNVSVEPTLAGCVDYTESLEEFINMDMVYDGGP